MIDYGHKYANRVLSELEKRIAREYGQAYIESKAKMDKYLANFEKADAEARKSLTGAEYKEWRRKHLMQGERWRRVVDSMAETYTNAGQVAAKMINGEMEGIFLQNANYAAYEMEGYLGTEYGFDLYDQETVKRILKDNADLLPAPSPDIDKDFLWNRRRVTSALTQGILQGESIPNIAKRLRIVENMDTAQSVRTARTAVTGAQNAGRQARYDQAKEMGLPLKKRWIATIDGRTRHEHGMADGLTVELDDVFLVGGEELMHPGDFSHDASGWNVYNCRCTMRTVDPLGSDWKRPNRMTYSEWYETKEGQAAIKKQKEDEAKKAAKASKRKKQDTKKTPKPIKTDYTMAELKKMDRAALEKIARQVSINNAPTQGITEQEALRRFDLLKGHNTTDQLRKYINKSKNKARRGG